MSIANYGLTTQTVSHTADADTIGTILQARELFTRASALLVLSYAGGGTSVAVTYQEKAGTSATGDNLDRKLVLWLFHQR